MAFVLADRVKETTTTTGTGTITLAGAQLGYQSFSAIGNGNVTYYTIAGQGTSEWEVGIGTYTSSGTTLSRDTILASSNSGSAVNFSAGTKDVWCDYPAKRAVVGGEGYRKRCHDQYKFNPQHGQQCYQRRSCDNRFRGVRDSAIRL